MARPGMWPRVAALVTAISVVALPLFAQRLFEASEAVTVDRETAGLDMTFDEDEPNEGP